MPSLRTLKIGVYDSLENFNIPSLLENRDGLKNLEIHVSPPPSPRNRKPPSLPQVESETSLASEMLGELPPKLSSITFTGRGLKNPSPGILQGVRSPSLSCAFRNTSIVRLASELFQNVGRARNISLTLEDNPSLQVVENPATGDKPGLHETTYLTEIRMAADKLTCDCGLG